MNPRPPLTLNTNLSGETLVDPLHSSQSWSSACSSSSTLGPQSDEVLLANSILRGKIRNTDDLLDLDISWPIQTWVCDAAIHHILRHPFERWHRERGAILLLLQAAESALGVNILGDTALHTLAGIPGPESADFMRFLFRQSDQAFADGTCERYQAVINSQNLFGNTALVVGALYNQPYCVRLLLEMGADPGIPGEYDKTALEFALERGYLEVACLLEASFA